MIDETQRQHLSELLLEQWRSQNPPVDIAYGIGFLPQVSHFAQSIPDPPSLSYLLSALCHCCPDLSITIDEVIAHGSRLVVCWTLRGKDTQSSQGRLPTGNPFCVRGIQSLRSEQGYLTSEWLVADRLDLLLQLGYVYLPKPPRITICRPARAQRQ